MPLHLRKRGNVWHARGSIRVGTETVHVREFSTGCDKRADAEAVAGKREADERAALLHGPAGRARRLTVADCLLAYMRRPGGVPPYDEERIADFNERIGAHLMAEAAAAWNEWLSTRGEAMAPGTAARWRAILQAALNYGARTHGTVAPHLPGVKQRNDDQLVYLTEREAERLLAAYSDVSRPVFIVLAKQGLRTGEALRLDWRHVDLKRQTLFVAETKTGRSRTVPMHPRVLEALCVLWKERGQPDIGPVFLSSRGERWAHVRGKAAIR